MVVIGNGWQSLGFLVGFCYTKQEVGKDEANTEIRENSAKRSLRNLCAVKERPDWGQKQVRSPEEIKVGKFYVVHQVLASDVVIRMISIDNVKYTGEQDNGIQVSRHLTDTSVLPYGSGWWNKNLWLEQLDVETFDEANASFNKPTQTLTWKHHWRS